ncbi:hypothetical protein BDP55DRAFT_653692 [Colletotrichum godetiae]|uniref:Uncharacterized protein n=1 Tax=Colletotrichum godetiae TaxID=1209918 RepID=A0AAJ0ASN5_9PEZI|nr:uncharacterized protein BDP55DRAFT_653692 [Colletotrichum godetiae]KAK1689639.1 hypothetical protein BDP55DRAFT_653692 [Colletotrichum godetiae]
MQVLQDHELLLQASPRAKPRTEMMTNAPMRTAKDVNYNPTPSLFCHRQSYLMRRRGKLYSRQPLYPCPSSPSHTRRQGRRQRHPFSLPLSSLIEVPASNPPTHIRQTPFRTSSRTLSCTSNSASDL